MVSIYRMGGSVELDELVGVAYGRQVTQELLTGDHHRRPVVVGVERIGRESLQIPVQKQVYVFLTLLESMVLILQELLLCLEVLL